MGGLLAGFAWEFIPWCSEVGAEPVAADDLVLLHLLASRQHNGDDSP